MRLRIIVRLLSLTHWFHVAALRERRAHRNWRALAYGVIAGVMAALRLMGATSILVALWFNAKWLGIPLFAVMASRTVAPLLVRYWLVPRGKVVSSYYLTRLQKLGEPDEASYALLVSAWASLHCKGEALARADAWIHAKCALRKTAGDTEIAAAALLTAARGPQQLDTAIALMRSVEWMVERHLSVRELAGEFLAVHDAQAKRWQLLINVDQQQWPASPLRYFLEGVATRKLVANRAERITDRELWARWVMAPHRRKTWPLLMSCTKAAPRSVVPPTETRTSTTTMATDAAAAPSSLSTALTAALTHLAEYGTKLRTLESAAIPRVGFTTATQLQHSALLWHAAIESADTTQWIAERHAAEHVRSSSPSAALDVMTADIAAMLAGCAKEMTIALPPLPAGRLQTALVQQLRHQTLDVLEQQFTSWAERCSDAKHITAANVQSTLPSLLDEWRTFVALRERYNQAVAVGGQDIRRLAFPRVFEAGNLVAVAWWNQQQQYVASHAISLWLLEEARAVGDSQAIELGTKNCRLAVKTRTGVVRSV